MAQEIKATQQEECDRLLFCKGVDIFFWALFMPFAIVGIVHLFCSLTLNSAIFLGLTLFFITILLLASTDVFISNCVKPMQFLLSNHTEGYARFSFTPLIYFLATTGMIGLISVIYPIALAASPLTALFYNMLSLLKLLTLSCAFVTGLGLLS